MIMIWYAWYAFGSWLFHVWLRFGLSTLMPLRQAWLNRCRFLTSVFWSLQIENSHLNARGRQEVNVVLSYLKTLRSSSEIAIAYCSDGSVTINLLQHLSRLLISWVLMYLNPALFLLEMHLEHFSGSPGLRLVLGMAVSGLGAIFWTWFVACPTITGIPTLSDNELRWSFWPLTTYVRWK